MSMQDAASFTGAGKPALTGSADIEALRAGGRFIRISSQGLRESHVHDVMITEEAPNYRAG